MFRSLYDTYYMDPRHHDNERFTQVLITIVIVELCKLYYIFPAFNFFSPPLVHLVLYIHRCITIQPIVFFQVGNGN